MLEISILFNYVVAVIEYEPKDLIKNQPVGFVKRRNNILFDLTVIEFNMNMNE